MILNTSIKLYEEARLQNKSAIKRLKYPHKLSIDSINIYNNTGKTIYKLNTTKSTNTVCIFPSMIFKDKDKDVYKHFIQYLKDESYTFPKNMYNKKVYICKVCYCKWFQFNRTFIKKILSKIHSLPEFTHNLILKYCDNTIIWNNETLKYSLITY
tara:strand:- start:2723 stop:3187 length:465 start_codon:yes stop_codon:yes gene_type:complete